MTTIYWSLHTDNGRDDTFLPTFTDYLLIIYSQTKYSEIAIAYLEDALATLKSELSNCYAIPHILGFIIPNDEKFRFSILSKLALGCTSDDENPCALDLSAQTESAFQNFRDRFLGNLYACDKDLREVGRMASSLSGRGRRQRVRYTDTKPMRMTFHKELSRRRSISTFKLFGNLGNSPTASGAAGVSATGAGMAASSSRLRRKSLSSDEYMRGGLVESRISNTYSSASSSNESRLSEDDTIISTTPSLAAAGGDDVYRSKRRSTGSGALAAIRRKSLTETIASAYRPSIHPSPSASYELSVLCRKRKAPMDLKNGSNSSQRHCKPVPIVTAAIDRQHRQYYVQKVQKVTLCQEHISVAVKERQCRLNSMVAGLPRYAIAVEKHYHPWVVVVPLRADKEHLCRMI
ncbi:hypothetical protein BDB00DRAFT_461893 [Zychaea mexicana]|uniref:uncharacterized protein n=1 Tax=Zychaea mexicana TaxID=64656 RepID=UPI0022FEDCA8|nr:uncharacterized protein BDB00DRAFT_461893 [Zychaea mexicana]KAI9492110.1 hypothetical protein BDB00DRAFT_461893 [Zychaea mexicana]